MYLKDWWHWRETCLQTFRIDISNNQANNSASRISVGTDVYLQLRSNNSCDNVDWIS
jgi:hypothetical protein